MSTRTHQERARRVADLLGPYPTSEDYGKPEACEAGRKSMAEVVAREMFPRELLKAARDLACLAEGAMARANGDGSEYDIKGELEEVRLVLALYPEPEEPDHG